MVVSLFVCGVTYVRYRAEIFSCVSSIVNFCSCEKNYPSYDSPSVKPGVLRIFTFNSQIL